MFTFNGNRLAPRRRRSRIPVQTSHEIPEAGYGVGLVILFGLVCGFLSGSVDMKFSGAPLVLGPVRFSRVDLETFYGFGLSAEGCALLVLLAGF